MTCVNCGEQLRPGSKFCRSCGQKVEQQIYKDDFLTCPRCDAEVRKGVRFCHNCGTELSEDITVVDTEIKKLCSRCGKVLKPGAVFCGGCGMSLLTPAYENTKPVKTEKTKVKKDTGLIVLIVLLIIAIAACAAVAVVIYTKNPADEVKTADVKGIEVENTSGEDEYVSHEEPLKNEDNSEPEENRDEPVEDDEDYLFPSDSEYITLDYLNLLTKDEVALIRNEIYARHGYVFMTEPYKSYFESKDWYYKNENFDESMFNSIEKENKDFIVEYEETMGWR